MKNKTNEMKMREQGVKDGRSAGSCVIDGNTSDETCRKILAGLEDCYPEVLDMLPELRLGEWADDPTVSDLLDAAGIEGTYSDEYEDDLFFEYSDAWVEGMQSEVERACRARLATPGVPHNPATKL